jgi:hypothetical protein
MERQITTWCQKILENWHQATPWDYAFATAWVIVVGYLVAKVNSNVQR